MTRIHHVGYHEKEFTVLGQSSTQAVVVACSLRAHLEQYEGFLVIRSDTMDDDFLNVVRLFLDQLGVALKNKLLTLQLQCWQRLMDLPESIIAAILSKRLQMP